VAPGSSPAVADGPKTAEPSPTPPAADDVPMAQQAAKVWFVRPHLDGVPRILSFIRTDSDPAKPQFDTLGGKMDPGDNGQYHHCARREVREEAIIPESWTAQLNSELDENPRGQDLVSLRRPSNGKTYQVAMWAVRLPPAIAYALAYPTLLGLMEMVPGSLSWRPAPEVVQNLMQFRTFVPYGQTLDQLVAARVR